MATKPAIQMTLEWLTGTIKFLYQQLSRLGSSQQADRMLSLSPRLIDESINFNNQLMAGIRQGIKFMESLVQQNQPLQIVPKPQEQRLILQNPKLLQSLQTESQVNIFISENADIAAIADAVRLQLFRQPVTTYEALTIQASRKYVNRMSDGALTQAQGQIMYKIFVRGTTKTRVWLQNPEPTHRGNRVKYYMTTFTPAVAVSIRDPITNQNRKILRDFEPAIPTNSRQA